jgi:hypothetical protein
VLAPAHAAVADSEFRALTQTFAADLRQGRHIVLWGPRGSGKSTLLRAVGHEIGNAHCALSVATSALDDITRALERAYTDTPTHGIKRRAARARLWRAADAEPGCLLLDHVTRVPTAMKGWLRRLRGGVVGVVLAVDVDSPRERDRLRALKIGCVTKRMPPARAQSLSRLLTRLWSATKLSPLLAPTRRALIRAARGRPGWLVQCAGLAADSRYWHDGQLQVHVLILDTEMSLRGVPIPAIRHGSR